VDIAVHRDRRHGRWRERRWSHCAVVAVEYLLSAVLSRGFAMQVIKGGRTVEMNGCAGEVHIIY
jgi:hypothetical protein